MKKRSSHSYQIHPDNCYGCGKKNEFGLKVDFTFSIKENRIKFPITFDKRHSNTPITVHGGILSSILDEAMGSICSHLGSIVLTNEMTIHYNKLVSLNQPYLVEAWKVGEDKKFFYIEGHIKDPDTDFIHTFSKGSFRKIPPRFFQRYFPGQRDKIQAIIRQVEINRKLIEEEQS